MCGRCSGGRPREGRRGEGSGCGLPETDSLSELGREGAGKQHGTAAWPLGGGHWRQLHVYNYVYVIVKYNRYNNNIVEPIK